ncbi:MAG: hypothetical protein JNL28_11395 [Planctomycetes bacterium]|nr:hypothetical protein [Planctomycetota bacterium]
MEHEQLDSSSARPAGRSSLARQLGWFGGGVALAVVLALTRDMQAAPAPPGDTVLWAVDRDAHRLYGLDRDLLIGRSVPVQRPLDVEATADGGTWVLRSEDGTSNSTMRLNRHDPRGALITELYLERVRDLDIFERMDALVLEHVNGSVRLARVREEGSLFPLLVRADLACVSGSSGSILCGTDTGRILRLDPVSGAVSMDVPLEGPISDIAPGPTPGSAWALDTRGLGRLYLLAPDLSIRWASGVGFACAHVAPVPGEERVWIADLNSPRVRRIGPAGVVELDRQSLPLGGLDRVIPWRDGGALALAPGAILHVAMNGNLAPGQGGFAWLSDAARVR